VRAAVAALGGVAEGEQEAFVAALSTNDSAKPANKKS